MAIDVVTVGVVCADVMVKPVESLPRLEELRGAAPSAEELEAALAEAIAGTGATSLKQMGVVMKDVQARLSGKRLDGKALSEMVRARLS